MDVVPGRLSLLVAALAAIASLFGVSADARIAATASTACTSYGVCAATSARPDEGSPPMPTVSTSSATSPRYVGQDTSLANNSGNKINLVEFVEAVPDGFTFVRDSLGACAASAGTVTCMHGNLPTGQTIANTLVFRTPPDPAQSMFAGTWCWDGCDSHAPGANRVDSLGVAETTTVVSAKGFDATYLPAGTEADLVTGNGVSATDTLAGTWTVPGQAHDLPATAKVNPNPPGFQACPTGDKLCRAGSWFAALSPGTTSFSPATEVVYTQYKSLIPPGTTESNYQVVYTPCLPGDGETLPPGGCVAQTLERCSSPTSDPLRCTEFVDKLPGGSYRVGVRIGSHNGYMM
jgi:hypothetical protein